MASGKYENFITQNTAPVGASHIGVYNSRGKKVGRIPLGNLTLPNTGNKLYSFGAISDIHIGAVHNGVNDTEDDFRRACQFLKDKGASYVYVCGDLTNSGTDEQFTKYRNLVTSTGIGVYSAIGNHDTYTYQGGIVNKLHTLSNISFFETYLRSGDAFIMMGNKSEGELFTREEMTWFAEKLEEHKDIRCFVFQHCLIGTGNVETCGNPYGWYNNQTWLNEGQTQMVWFENLLKQYHNVIWFHGHSHFSFRYQSANCKYANYDESRGYRSVHIPSVSHPRANDGDGDGKPDYLVRGSEGYLVDVYENGIHLQGVNFVTGEFMPIASYWINMKV